MSALDTVAAPEISAELSPVVRSARRLALRRFMRNRLALGSAVLLVIIVIAAVFAPLIAQHPPNAIDLNKIRTAPSSDHWLGTDSTGRDVFSRLLYGGQVSLLVGVVAAALSVVVGTLLGALAGLVRGAADAVIMRFADIVLSVPAPVLMIMIAGIFGPSITVLVIVIAATHWPQPCRLAQGVTLSVREKDFVSAARASGARTWWLVRTHIVPAALAPMIVNATIAVATAILLEASMSFLGLGVQPPRASWGNMLNDAQSLTIIQSMPWLWLPPGIAIAVTVLAVNFLGDGLRDAFDPRQAGGR